MKLMTYNILDGGDGRLEMIAEIIKNENPDFVTINEANGFDLNDNLKLEKLSKDINLPYYHLAMSGEEDYHVAVLSKKPFKTVQEVHPLMRAGIISVFDTNIGELAIASTHLSPTSEDSKITEINLILKRIQVYQNAIIMGDMNSLSSKDGYSKNIVNKFNTSQIKKFTNGGELQFEVTNIIARSNFIDSCIVFGQQQNTTVPTSSNQDQSHSKMRLDYIFVSESLKNNLSSYKVVKNELTEKASDHYPIIIELKNIF